jgi:hypothetical protein
VASVAAFCGLGLAVKAAPEATLVTVLIKVEEGGR